MSKMPNALVIAMVLAVGAAGPVQAAAQGANAICHDPALSRQEQSLCVEQIAKARSVDEQKKLQAKFRDRVDKKKPK